ncbi:class II aldolase/adducin family protein [Marinobacterium aestuariivivens]|uniref:Class II aldolase/adducin family protein n=1 Tax=Marinobacterium aestuariivivens TaxID=1698799 RepID=A0ABW2A9M6_9GAMM
MTSYSDSLNALLDDLVDANLILFNEGVVDAFGHVSVRNPDNPDHYFLARNMAPGLVTREDLIEFDLDGHVVDGDTRKVYLERYIHGEIYRARPDVMAVVHSHSPSVVPFSAVKSNPLRPLCHMSGFIGKGAPIFEIRDVAGDATDLLITNPELGAALSKTLGHSTVVLMRGHGSTVVAPTLKQAVYRAVYVEVNAKLQADASRLGPIEFLSEGETRTTQETIEGQVERPWQLWKMRAHQAQKQWLDHGL